MTNQAGDPDSTDLAARELYARWTADWAELERFLAEKFPGAALNTLTPRQLVGAMLGMERPRIVRPLLVAWTDRSPWATLRHRHHFNDRFPIRGHVYIRGPRTSTDDGHYHTIEPSTEWSSYTVLDLGSWL